MNKGRYPSLQEFIFVSDFDGTMSAKDFYHIIMDAYLGAWGKELYASWKRQEMHDVEFLSTVFKAINRSEAEIDEDILRIEMDADIPEFVNKIKSAGGEFLVLSAGTNYYIKRALTYHQIDNIQIVSNDGKYENKGITLIPPAAAHPFYSERYGIDKAAVVKDLRTKYKKIYYAGDSGPDVNAALEADIAFATKELVSLLSARGANYVPFSGFAQIATILEEKGVL